MTDECKHCGVIARVGMGGIDAEECPARAEIDIRDFTIGSLMTAVMTGEIKMPIWVKCGRTKHRITEENKEGVCKGLLLALEKETQPNA